MFERNRVESRSPNQKTAVPVEISTNDGGTFKGKFYIASTRQIFDVLNGPDVFLEFEDYGGTRRLIAKATLTEIKLVNAPAPVNLERSLREVDDFNPYVVLGVERSMPWDKIRERYLKLAKIYHPDSYSGAKLPTEVEDYMSGMARRVNAAFEALDKPRKVVKRAENRAQPIYESQPAR